MKRFVPAMILVALVVLLVSAVPAFASSLKTTTEDGSVVNENGYRSMEESYVTAGPQNSKPAAGRLKPNTVYVFVVVEPNKRDVLSLDPAICRLARTNEYGFVAEAIPANVRYKGKTYTEHKLGVFAAYAEYGARTYHLPPYAKTSNNGGVYKVLAIEREYYKGNLNEIGSYSDYLMAGTKQDTFKIKSGKPFTPANLALNKFHDANGNGIKDPDEVWVTGWPIEVVDPDGITDTYYTPSNLMVTAGNWTATEAVPGGVRQTVASLDGVAVSPLSPTVTVPVAGTDGEKHEVVYGNVGLGKITAKKVYGYAAPGTIPVASWKFKMTGTTATGASVGPIYGYTGSDGKVTFDGLLPGTYTVEELLPNSQWVNVTPLTQTVTIQSNLVGGEIKGDNLEIVYTNYCIFVADFGTKGWWHNVNGNALITADDIAFHNSLVVYAEPTEYWPTPFESREEIAEFLVSDVSESPHRFQLAQQLVAFNQNLRHYAGGIDALIALPGREFESGSVLVVEAIAAWQSGDPAACSAMITRLNEYNNFNEVVVVSGGPVPFSYNE